MKQDEESKEGDLVAQATVTTQPTVGPRRVEQPSVPPCDARLPRPRDLSREARAERRWLGR